MYKLRYLAKYGEPSLVKCSPLASYMNSVFRTAWKAYVGVKNNNKIKRLPVYVTKGNDIPLLCRKWMNSLGINLNFGGVYRVEECRRLVNFEKFLEQNWKLFSSKLGLINDQVAQISMSAGAPPKIFRPRSIPLSLKQKVEEEVYKLMNPWVIIPVNPLKERFSWASPIVVFPKENRRVRIRAAFKVSINKYVQADPFPISRF
ncbi:hypothetical protein RF11_11293 [Thelohanellus kitauei]|uniref:Uncharacterized protein n=1 Tax=Thelohanellus kitauei TaxID=669202 RepID=A0A0C2I7M1_THEKT|nr:hypothetical protein RF11_11293 [Thelohanellus kitauei]